MSRQQVHSVQRRLEGKVAIITGGASGIGEATVRLFVKHGARVIVADITDEAGIKVVESLSPRAKFIHCDVTKEEDVRAAVDSAVDNYGRLDIMFNNAGIIDFEGSSVAECDMKQFERVMNVNVNGVMNGIKHAARVMVPNRKGSIISTSSISGILGGGNYSYIASKHAIIGLTKNGAAELGKYGIRVNCVAPSGVATNLTMQFFEMNSEDVEATFSDKMGNLKGVVLKAEDVAEAALYLASDEAKYVSGHNLVVDGGYTVVCHALC